MLEEVAPNHGGRQRRFLRLDDLVRSWARDTEVDEYEAAGTMLGVLREHPHCLTVECRRLTEIRRGISDDEKSARRQLSLERMLEIVDARSGIDQLGQYSVNGDCLAGALAAAGARVPACLADEPAPVA